MQEIQEHKEHKAKEELANLKKIQMATADYMKQQAKESKKAKQNQAFQFEKMEPSKVANTLKNKARAPAEASMIHDQESLSDDLKKVINEYKLLLEDSKNAVLRVSAEEIKATQSRKTLNEELDKKSLLNRNGKLEKMEMPKEEALGDMSTDKLIEKANKPEVVNPMDSIV